MKLAYADSFAISESAMFKSFVQITVIALLLLTLSGCIAATIVSTAVDVTTTAVGAAVDVVDAVTPDIIDDDEDEEDEEDKKKAD